MTLKPMKRLKFLKGIKLAQKFMLKEFFNFSNKYYYNLLLFRTLKKIYILYKTGFK